MNPLVVIGITFFILIFGGGLIIILYLFTERQKNAAKAENHTWVQIIPKAGMERNYRQPNELIGGVACIRIPDTNGKINEFSPIHVLGETAEFPAMYPPGKMKFVQCPMQKIIYYEGDMEPLSNVSDMPVISGQLIANITNGLVTAAVEVIRRSEEDSGGAHKPINKVQLFMYILLGGTLIASIISMVFAIKGGSSDGSTQQAIQGLSDLIKQALGLK